MPGRSPRHADWPNGSASRRWTPAGPCRSPTRASTPSSRTTRCATSRTGRRCFGTGTGCCDRAVACSSPMRWCSPGSCPTRSSRPGARSASTCSCRPARTKRCCVTPGFTVLAVEDVTENAAGDRVALARRARPPPGAAGGQGRRGQFRGSSALPASASHTLSVERRLSRYAYLAEKRDAGATNPT